MNPYEKEFALYFELKGVPDSSRESYTRRFNAFAKYIQERDIILENASVGDIQEYILYLKNERELTPGTINTYISAVRYFYIHILGHEWEHARIPRMKRESTTPAVIPKEDILALMDATTNPKHKAYIALMYGSGLRVSEVAELRIKHIDSKTMCVCVEKAKHGTVRYTILSNTALEILRKYFKAYLSHTGYKNDDWLFKGSNPGEHISTKAIKNTLINLRDRIHLDVDISSHALRHSFATHSLENGVDPVYLQQMLGHKRLSSTVTYLHFTSKHIMGIKSPLDFHKGDDTP